MIYLLLLLFVHKKQTDLNLYDFLRMPHLREMLQL